MNPLRHELLDQLLGPCTPPCISIYMPLSAAFPGEMENNPRFDTLLRRIEDQLKAGYPEKQANELLDRCRQQVGQREFWNDRRAGLALFCSPDFLMTVDLPRQVPDTVIVADTFHTKPLIRLLQTTGRFQVLCLTRKDVRLLEGNRDELTQVPLKNMPHTIQEAFEREAQLQPAVTQPVSANKQDDQHHPGEVSNSGSIPIERWFRIVDRGIWENHSRHDRLPLLLCSVDENHDLFRKVSKNEFLQPDGITLDPNHVQLDRIREEAWRIIEPRYHERTQQAIDNFQAARAHQAGDDNPLSVARSAAEGRVSLLLVEADRKIGGRLDADSGDVQFGDISDPKVGDLLDDTAETVLKRGGEVMVIPPNLMPTQTGMAAVYRY